MQSEELQVKERSEMSLDKKQIYIVDDDESVRRSLGILLRAYGFDVKTFSSAEEFFVIVPARDLGLLTLDIHMPGLDGWETLKRLKTLGYKCPVIIISADKALKHKERALKAGAIGFLEKPFNDQELVDLINQAFNNNNKGRAA